MTSMCRLRSAARRLSAARSGVVAGKLLSAILVLVQPAAQIEPLGSHIVRRVETEPDDARGDFCNLGAAAERDAPGALVEEGLKIASSLDAGKLGFGRPRLCSLHRRYSWEAPCAKRAK